MFSNSVFLNPKRMITFTYDAIVHIIFHLYIIQQTEYKKNFYQKTNQSRRKTTAQTIKKIRIIFACIRVIFIVFILGALKRQRTDGNGKRNLGLKFAEPSLVTSRATSPF